MFRTLDSGSEEVDVLGLYMSDVRSIEGRPWVMFNMVSSVDGATAVKGGSAQLNDDDDKYLFKVLRTVADVILVGAGTVRAENYGPVSLDEERRAFRQARDRTAAPLLVIVTGRFDLDPDARVFSNPDYRPMVITSTEANPAKMALIGDSAEVVILPEITPSAIIGHLGAASIILCEGGPTLNGQFAEAGLLDEMNLTIAPKVVAGASKRVTYGEPVDPPLDMRLDRALRGDRSLFLRYLREDT